jgi:hypothetical protein
MCNIKKVGILTFHSANNYGAVYQAYALSKYLESLGHEVFVLNYQMDKANFLIYLKNPISTIRKIFSRKAFSIRFIRERTQYKKGIKRETKFYPAFNTFRKKYLNVTDAAYSYKNLLRDCPDADVFITGSDQVWATDFLFSSPAYLLGFVPKDVKRISYAPSFGKSQLEPYLHRVFKEHIKEFDAVSVRENDGLRIIKHITGNDAVKVLDPTLLIDNYSEIIDYSLVPELPFILTYRLHQEYELAHWMSGYVEKISADMELPVFSVSTNCPWDLNLEIEELHPTPGQLLGLLEKSSLVLTNSFHGTVFSILFGVKFLTFARDRFDDKQNPRMTELLASVGLDALFCKPFTDFKSINQKLNFSYSHEGVHAKLDKIRGTSIQFLRDALL